MNYGNKATAKEMAGRILGSYRDNPANPEIYAAELVAILADYPEDVQRQAVRRLQTTLQRLPSLKQCKDALDATRAIDAPKKSLDQYITNWKQVRDLTKELTEKASAKYRDLLKGDTQLQWWIQTFANMVAQYEAMGITKAEEAAAWHFGISDMPDPWTAGNYHVQHGRGAEYVPSMFATSTNAQLDFTE